jgi:hypothetical protein
VSGLPGDFTFRYPTAGASEGLRALIDEYGARARRDAFQPEIHVFDGDYEGFAAYAEAAYIPVRRHDRGSWADAVAAVSAASATRPIQYYISAPSAIDGNCWPHFEPFMTAMADRSPRAEVIVDLTYVGCIHRKTRFRVDYPNVPAIVFSLSKPVGAYYDRIGGVIARSRLSGEPYPGLFGNKWFKNLTSLAIGVEFMKAHTVYELPRKYALVQSEAISTVVSNLKSQSHEIDLEPCDVFLLARGEMPDNPAEIHEYLKRPADGRPIVRACLTPTMAALIGTAGTSEVMPRYYEKI